jgi:uncharacterized phage protein (TIGR01671 family)
MREYKFRVWDEEDKKMYYDMCFIPDWGFIKNGYEDCPWTDTFESRIVMQYTELKDNDGKEIYESDILEYKHTGEIVIVDWDNEIGCYIFDNENEIERDVYIGDMSLSNEYKIIGNKYENPELLEKVNGMDERDSNDM